MVVRTPAVKMGLLHAAPLLRLYWLQSADATPVDLGVAGLAVLGVRGASVPLPRSLLLYDAKKAPHLQVSPRHPHPPVSAIADEFTRITALASSSGRQSPVHRANTPATPAGSRVKSEGGLYIDHFVNTLITTNFASARSLST